MAKTLEEFGEEYRLRQQKIEEDQPSFVETGLASARTSITGASTFLNMVDRKHIMPNNDGEEGYYLTQEFKDIVNEVSPDISPANLDELTDAKNGDYLRAKIQNQKNHQEALKTIEESGMGGAALEMTMAVADPVSWLGFGGLFKLGNVGKTALNIQRSGANTLYTMAQTGISAGGAVYASESIIQAEAGVPMEERLNNMTLYGTAFGVALPLIGKTFSSVATGEGRKSLARNTTTLMENIPGTGSLRGFFSLSSADQLRTQGTSDLARSIGDKATTKVNSAKDSNGNFITDSEDTAMDYVEMTIERETTNLHYGTYENSKKSGMGMVEQGLEDGKAWNDFTNGVEQTIRKEVGALSREESDRIYKEATGIEELPTERISRLAEQEITKADKDLQIVIDRTETAKKTDLDREVQLEFRAREKTRLANLKKAEEAYAKSSARYEPILKKDLETLKRIEDGKSIVKPGEATHTQLVDKIKKNQDILNKHKTKVDSLKTESVIDDKFINRTQARLTKKYQPTINKVTKDINKRKEAINKKLEKDLKDKELPDYYDIVQAHLKKQAFDTNRFKIPDNLAYIQNFYSKFGEDATTYGLKGIAGKDSRGYGHIKYNHEEILSDVAEAERKIKEMLLDDELTKALMAKNEVTMEEVEETAKNLIQSALDRDFQNKYLDGGRGVQSTSATRKRKLRMNRALYPELFVKDIQTIGMEYADRIGGRIGLKKTYGLDADNTGSISNTINKQLDEIAKAGQANGASKRAIKRDVENARAVFETVLGSRRYNKDPDSAVNKTSRIMRKSASALYNAGFIKYAIVEPTVAISRYGLGPVIKAFVPAFDDMKIQLKNSDPNSPMVKLMRQAGLAVQTQRNLKYNRYENMEITPTTGKVEMFLDKVAHVGRKYSGFNYINDMSDWISGGAALTELQRVMGRSGNLTKAEASRLARYGLSSDDLVNLNRQDIIKSSDGQVTDWNFDNWRDQDLAKKFVRYLSRATRDTIMRADGTRVHRWQSDVNNPLAALGLQFTQMPVALYERLLLNFGDEVSTRTFVGMFSALSAMYMILKLEDIALVKAGAKDAEEDDTTLLIKAATRTPFAGIVPNYLDLGLMMTGNAPLGSQYAPRKDLSSYLGAGYSVADRAFKTITGFSDGINQTDAANMMKLTPWLNSIPIFNIGFKALQDDLKEQGKLNSTSPVSYDKPLYELMGE